MTGGGDPSPAGAAQTGWRRLHPLSPLVSWGGHAVVAIVLVSSAPRRAGSASARFALAVAAIAAVAGVIRWLVTRWRLHRGELQIDTGLIRRQSYRVPLSRIQAVDIISPFMARLFGLAEVRVVVAGRGAGRTRLAYLPAEEAQRVRGRLLALAHGLHAETPEPPSQPLLEVDNGRVAWSAVLSPAGALMVVVIVLDVALTILSGQPETLTILLPILLPWLFIMGGGVFRAVNANFSFRVDEAPDGLRLSRGLLQTRAETIPYGRIQAVRWVEPLLWRPFGWCRIEVDVARQRSADRGQEGGRRFSRNLLPVGRREEAAFLLARALPGATTDPPSASRPPRRAALRAPLSYHYLAAWHDDRHLCARTGRVRPSTVVVPLHKVQSLRLRTGPLLRLLRLATLHADTAGRGWQAAARCRDAAEAQRLLELLPELARRARTTTSPDRSPPSPPSPVATEG